MMFFRVKTRPENAVGMLGTKVGALFRLNTSVDERISRWFFRQKYDPFMELECGGWKLMHYSG